MLHFEGRAALDGHEGLRDGAWWILLMLDMTAITDPDVRAFAAGLTASQRRILT
jgi:hypothetical protein